MPHRPTAIAAAASAAVTSAASAAVALALLSGPALAASAHNSQLGSDGPNNRTCEATPYFRYGGCLSETLESGSTDQVLPRAGPAAEAPYRPRPPLRGLGQ